MKIITAPLIHEVSGIRELDAKTRHVKRMTLWIATLIGIVIGITLSVIYFCLAF